LGASNFTLATTPYKYLPHTLANLTNLQSLTLFGRFDSIPTWIGNFTRLTQLSLCGFFSNLPSELANLKYLDTLRLYGDYKTIPDWIFEYEYLQDLVLNGRFDSVSDKLGNMQRLTRLGMAGKFDLIPAPVFKLHLLTNLNMSFNAIRVIPSDILNLSNLIELDVSDNPIEMPPSEIVFKVNEHTHRMDNLEAIRNYYESLRDEEEDHLYEAKLLIVGEGGAGKTSFANKILDPKYELVHDEKSTEGIDVMQWTFPINSEQTFRVNLWDFGGQEIYHATHQFFLTNRSLYVLIADSRKEDTDFNYWLNIVELLGEGSPVVIIKNEKQDRKRQIGEPQLRSRFPNIAKIIGTNLETNRDLGKVIDEIIHQLRHLPHIGTPLPRSWVAVRDMLEQDSRNYITVDDYYNICKVCDLHDRSKQETVIDYLHDLGVCLHFKSDPILKRYVILKPQWGTRAVYTVLDNQQVINNFGRFGRNQLDFIWNDISYKGMCDELLQLMMKFKLCYRIPDIEDVYIAPQLLSENQPDYNWDDADNLFLRYQYEFMPKGLVIRLIVAMHRYIPDDLVWKTGVILERTTSRAEVTEHYQNNRIHIRVTGRNKKDFLAIIMHEIEEIHATYQGLKYDRLIPCNCEKCNNLTEPHFFKYDMLQRSLEETNEVMCEISFLMINTRNLLDDALPKSNEIKRALRRDKSINIARVDRMVVENVELQQKLENYGVSVKVEQNRNKSESEFHGNFQAGNANFGEQTFGDNAHIKFESGVLNDAPDGSQLAELRELLKQLEAELRNVPSEQAQDAELVQKYANDAAQEAGKENPNPRALKITGEGLKAAAENLLSVAPIAVQIATVLLGLRA
jgi:internalin A